MTKILRPGDQNYSVFPERPTPKPETIESVPQDWITYYDTLTAVEAEVLYKDDPKFARRVDLLLEQRRTRGY